MKVRTVAYLHGDKYSMRDLGSELGLTEDAIDRFRYALYEVEITLEVDTETGEYTIISVKE
jgi:hypothetical protein